MTRDSDTPDKRLSVPADNDVGYGKPPEKTRFKKGQSGNPRGRPKGAKSKRPGRHEARLKEIILDEAYRDIPVRDGDRTVSIPVAQAVVRSMALGAAKGNHRQQRAFAELLASTESARNLENEESIKCAIEYKNYWEEELRRRKKFGITDLPEPLPHPDHVVIDYWEGTAKIIGPTTREEKAAVDSMKRNMRKLYTEVFDVINAAENCENPRERRKLEREIQEKSEFIKWLNTLAPREED